MKNRKNGAVIGILLYDSGNVILLLGKVKDVSLLPWGLKDGCCVPRAAAGGRKG